MTRNSTKGIVRGGFTLVELLVVIAIIGILLASLVLAGQALRKSARITESLATIGTIESGLENLRQSTGEDYPPSSADSYVASPYFLQPRASVYGSDPWESAGGLGGQAGDRQYIVTGANLLVWALAGADLLGTPGFMDLDGDGKWTDDTGYWDGGLYAQKGELQTIGGGPLPPPDDPSYPPGEAPPLGAAQGISAPRGTPLHRRYGPFIDTSKAVRMAELGQDVLRLYPGQRCPQTPLLLLDGFGYPILYYRANPHAPSMIPQVVYEDEYYEDEYDAVQIFPGTYNPNDNIIYTGGGGYSGMDLGAGGKDWGVVQPGHKMNTACYGPDGLIWVDPDPAITNLNEPVFDGSFVKFIWNRQVTRRNEPVNKDSYLLVSPGPDALWGTEDDITNFK